MVTHLAMIEVMSHTSASTYTQHMLVTVNSLLYVLYMIMIWLTSVCIYITTL